MARFDALDNATLYGIVDHDISELATFGDAMDNNKRRETISQILERIAVISRTVSHLEAVAKTLQGRLVNEQKKDGLLAEDHSEIKIVPDAVRRVWER